MSDLPPRSRHRMTVLECPLRAISRHSLAIRPLYSLAIRPSTAATHGRLPWGVRLAWKLNSKKLLKKIRLEMCLRIILFSFAIVTIIVSAPPAQAEQIGSAEQGLTIARERCGSCHLVVKEDGRSTNEKAPTFARIANTPGMSSAALRSALNTSHSSMPNLIIKDEDADSIIAYILSLRDGQ